MSNKTKHSKGLSPVGPPRWAAWLGGALILSGAIACRRGGSDRHRGTDSTSGGEERIERESCLGQGLEERAVDVDGNGVVDLTNVFRESTRVCSAFDLNFDGDVDLVRFYEADGETPRLEMHDFDFDARIDQVALFEGGHRVRSELDTNFDDRPDLFLWCQDGTAVRVHRERLNRGRVDTWEDYERGYLREARYDEDGNGEPERFEFYRDGLLVAEALDRNENGTIEEDERSAIEDEFAGRPQLVLCDPAEAEAAEARAAAAESAATESSAADEPANPDEPAPWDEVEADAGVPPDAGAPP